MVLDGHGVWRIVDEAIFNRLILLASRNRLAIDAESLSVDGDRLN